MSLVFEAVLSIVECIHANVRNPFLRCAIQGDDIWVLFVISVIGVPNLLNDRCQTLQHNNSDCRLSTR